MRINLCTNAWQAIDRPGGRITVGLGSVRLSLAETQDLGLHGAGPLVHLWVRDTGQGIDVATRGRMFEPLFTTKAVGQGTSLRHGGSFMRCRWRVPFRDIDCLKNELTTSEYFTEIG